MKQLFLICAVVALVGGCGGKKTSKPEAKANPPSTSPAQEVNNNQPKTDPKSKSETKNPEPPKTEPKAEVKKPLAEEVSAKIIEAAIRSDARKPTGELTKADLEKVTSLFLWNNQLTDVKGLEKLTQLKSLHLDNNPDLTKAQIDELKKALPKCRIQSNPKK